MTDIYSATLLVALLWPPANFGGKTPFVELVPTPVGATPQHSNVRERIVLYFDAPPRPYSTVIRR